MSNQQNPELVYDVAVIGGGPAGVGAAVAAARNGARTVLIERYGFMGGMATNASVPVFCPYSDGRDAVIGGIGLEVLEAMKREAWVNPFVEENNGIVALDWVPIDPEILKRVLDDMVTGSGCHLMLHSFVEGVTVRDGTVHEITVAHKGGRSVVRAANFIDASGDADVVAMAGGAFEFGDARGLVQAVTLCFRLANVNTERFLAYKAAEQETGNLHRAVQKARDAGDFPFSESSVATFVLQSQGMAGLNFGHIFEINPLSPADLTRAEVESRRNIPALTGFLRKYVPGLEQAVIASTGPFIGIRESRRITGRYRMTRQDYLNRTRFEDTIALYAYPIDIHAARADEIQTDEKSGDFHALRYAPGESYGIPFRALLPEKLRNVAVAGRSLSSDRAMHGSFRVMPCCFATGQAAGTAAAMASQAGIQLEETDVRLLAATLRAQGAVLPADRK